MPTLRTKCLAILVLGILSANAAQAQLLRGLKDRVVNAIENRAEQRAEERAVDEVEQEVAEEVAEEVEQRGSDADSAPAVASGNSGGGQNAGNRADTSIFGRMFNSSNVTVRDEYSFNIAVTFEILSFDERGRPAADPMEMVFHYADDAPYTGTRFVSGEGAESGAAMMIYDFDNMVMLMLMETDDSRFAIPTNWDISEADMNEAWDLSDSADSSAGEVPEFEHIGSRTINGYDSEGYRFRSDEQVSEIWVSDEVAPGIGRIFQANRSVSMLGSTMPEGYPQGMVMEMNSENTRTGEKVQMRTTDIDTDASVSYRMSDYPVMNLGAMGQ